MKRKKEIEKIAEIYYNKYKKFQKKSFEVFKKEILDMFLNTNLTIEEIEDKIKELGKIKNIEKEETTKKDHIYIIVIIVALLISTITIASILVR